MEGRRLGGEGVEHVLCEAGWKVLWYVVDDVGVSAWFAAESGDARFGVASGHVGREVELQQLVMKEADHLGRQRPVLDPRRGS